MDGLGSKSLVKYLGVDDTKILLHSDAGAAFSVWKKGCWTNATHHIHVLESNRKESRCKSRYVLTTNVARTISREHMSKVLLPLQHTLV